MYLLGMSNLAAPLDISGTNQMRSVSGKPRRAFGNSTEVGPGYSRTIILLMVCGIAVIAAIIIGAAIIVTNSRVNALTSSERELGNTALLLAKHIDQQIEELENVQNNIISQMQSLGIVSRDDLERQMSGEDVHLQLENRISGLSYLDNVAIINATGQIINASSGRPNPRINVADRDYFNALSSDPHLTSYISKPIQGRTGGGWKIIIARKFSAPNGELLAIVGGAIRLNGLENYFRSIILGKHSVIALQRADGLMLARYPNIEATIGQIYKGVPNGLKDRERGIVRLAGKMEGKNLIMAAQRLSHYPIIVSAGMDTSFALTNWRNNAIFVIGVAGVAVLVIAIMVFVIRRQMLQGEKQFEQALDQKKLQVNTAFGNMPNGLVMFDSQTRLVICNDRYRQIYNLSPDLAKPGCSVIDLLKYRLANGTFLGDPEKYVQELLASLAKGEMVKVEAETSDGRIVFVTNQPMADGGWVATHQDITEQRRSEQELDDTKRFLDSIIESVPMAIVVKDAKTRNIILVNRAAEAMFKLGRNELLGKSVFDIYPPKDAEFIDTRDTEFLQDVIDGSASEYEIEVPLHGARIHATNRIAIRDAQGDPKYLVAVINDVTERKKSERRIAFMAHHDALTGLANRAAMTEKIKEAAARQRRSGEPFTILLLDLDRFKFVNDSLGHVAGDALLHEVAARLKESLRENDLLARLGGDEFAIIQVGETDQREAARVLADRVISVFDKPFNIEGVEVNIGTSIGIALAPDHATDSENLLKMADLALYRAKAAGRHRYRVFDPEMSAVANQRQEIESELRRAIQQDELEVHYQPIIDAKTRKICGAEALVRWQHPTKGAIPPDQFIPLAEETGLITQIGEWVLHTACTEAATWPAGVKLAVNLSPVQFRKTNLPEVVMYALAQSGLPPERLELEITETALIGSATECLPALRQFKNLGIAIALDDFGTGYSSLSQLRLFPFDKIKIDKSFTQNLTKRSECAAIISATLALAHSLNIATTAEGVETPEQYKLLRLAGVTSLQGYLFKRPCPVSEIDFYSIYGATEIEDAA
jgi:diguanylate cyclase (GGDEF)-like protein/PAS domain S-box-containing protein